MAQDHVLCGLCEGNRHIEGRICPLCKGKKICPGDASTGFRIGVLVATGMTTQAIATAAMKFPTSSDVIDVTRNMPVEDMIVVQVDPNLVRDTAQEVWEQILADVDEVDPNAALAMLAEIFPGGNVAWVADGD